MKFERTTLKLYFLVFATSLMVCTSCSFLNNKKESDSKEMVVWYNKPAGNAWLNGLFIGNGYMGANVFGRT
ncbi:MAG TPA: hypothetical protein P5257_11975, partial [Bacteroidales bacterium]|nr:hypothetical protein [Bacteroidales bacterium]